VLNTDDDYAVLRRKKGTEKLTPVAVMMTKRQAIDLAHKLNSGFDGQEYIFTVEENYADTIIINSLDAGKINTGKLGADKLKVWDHFLAKAQIPRGLGRGFDW
jgi:hypothetical protein